MEGNACKLACNGEIACANRCELSHVCFPTEKSSLKENAPQANATGPSTTIPAIKPSAAPRPSMPEDIASSTSAGDSVAAYPIAALVSLAICLISSS